jgi:hypothetical protein
MTQAERDYMHVVRLLARITDQALTLDAYVQRVRGHQSGPADGAAGAVDYDGLSRYLHAALPAIQHHTRRLKGAP